MNYVNLYTQTEYSILSSNISISSLGNKALKKNYTALGIADNDNMYGVVKFYLACRSANIKPIIGMRLSLYSPFGYDNALLLYAKNNKGYHNLMRIATIKGTTKDKIKLEDIKDYLSDLVVIIPSDENELIKSYLISDFGNMQIVLKEYLSLKQIDNLSLYLGLDLQTKDSKYKLGDLIYLANQYGIKPVAIRKTNYFEDEDYEVYKILRSVANGGVLYSGSEKEENSSLLNALTMADMYRKYPELVDATEEIASMCNVELDFDNYHMPKYILKDNTDNADTYLQKLSFAGLKKRLAMDKIARSEYDKYIERLEYELDVIKKMGFSDYFLIVYDFIRYAKKEGILVGPGRGSAVGSLVAYSVGITEVNPIKYNLIFERFLNTDRVSLPDVDTDFPDDRRGDVIKYVSSLYGMNRVAHICTFGRYGPKKAVDDIARVIQLKGIYLNDIKGAISAARADISLKDIIKESPELTKKAENNETIKMVLHLALRMENLPYSVSVHAAGVIVSDKDLCEYTPLSMGNDGIYQTQYDDDDVEKLGLVKIDFLGIKNLTMIVKTLDKIGITGQDVLKIYRLPLDCADVYKTLAQGLTSGIFQLKSEGMTKTLVNLKTNSFNDLISAIALYRKGAMKMIPSFTKRKLGQEKITYPHPSLEPILKETYGIIVYQEQVLEIARAFAGFTRGEADILRKAISKKNEELMAQQKEKFINGAISNGHSKEDAIKIFNLMSDFAGYGFNKSHAVGYSLVAYQMAYLKTRHFKEFMSVIMSYSDDDKKVKRENRFKSYIRELSARKVTLELPDINKSEIDYHIEESKLYLPLVEISGISDIVAKSIIDEREKNGSFKDYDDFIMRTKAFLTEKMVESLIYSGALDSFGITRKSMILEYDKSLNLGKYGDLFKEEIKTREFDSEEFSFVDISKYERQALGFNIKYDIFSQFGYLKRQYNCVSIASLKPGERATIFFVIDRIKVTQEKSGDDMAFLTVSDETSSIDCPIFSQAYQDCKDYLVPGKFFAAKGRCQKRNDNIQFVLDKVFITNKHS